MPAVVGVCTGVASPSRRTLLHDNFHNEDCSGSSVVDCSNSPSHTITASLQFRLGNDSSFLITSAIVLGSAGMLFLL